MDRSEFLALLLKTEKTCGITATLYIFYGSNIRMKIAYSRKTCETCIDEMQLSVRAWNALKRSGVNTIGQLIDIIQCDGLMRIRNLGKKSMVEIKTRILETGFRDLNENEKVRFFEYVIDNNTVSWN